jgi:hypothetical protein
MSEHPGFDPVDIQTEGKELAEDEVRRENVAEEELGHDDEEDNEIGEVEPREARVSGRRN